MAVKSLANIKLGLKQDLPVMVVALLPSPGRIRENALMNHTLRNCYKDFRGIFPLLVCLGIVSGCGGSDGLDRLHIKGTVKVNGAPLESGRISFLPTEGTSGPATGTVIESGQFEIPLAQGPVQGKHRIEIMAVRPTGQKIREGSGSENPDALVEEVEQYIPQKYNQKSELTADLNESNAQSVEFDLKLPE